MFVNVQRISAKTVDTVRDHATGQATTTAVLRFSLRDDASGAEREIRRSISVFVGEGPNWREVEPKALEREWERLEAYFDGACLDGEAENLFTLNGNAASFSEFGLSEDDEMELTLELNRIDNAFGDVA